MNSTNLISSAKEGSIQKLGTIIAEPMATLKAGGVSNVAKQLGEPFEVLNKEQTKQAAAKLMEKVPAETYRGFYMPQVNIKPYVKE